MSADGDATRPVAVRDLLARNLRRLRLDGSAGPEDIARAARGYGLDITASWVTAVERGQKQITAEQLVALPFVLTDALGHRVSLADLLLCDEPVLLARTAEIRQAPLAAGYLREVLTAAPYHRHFAAPGVGVTSSPPTESATQRAAARMREIGRAGLGDVDIRALARAEAAAGDLEEKLARRLGVAPIVVIAAAAGLWGRSLTEEREERLAPDPFAAPDTPGPKPAAVMRRLTMEITARLARGTDAVRAAELAATAASSDASSASSSDASSAAPSPASPGASSAAFPAAPSAASPAASSNASTAVPPAAFSESEAAPDTAPSSPSRLPSPPPSAVASPSFAAPSPLDAPATVVPSPAAVEPTSTPATADPPPQAADDEVPAIPAQRTSVETISLQ